LAAVKKKSRMAAGLSNTSTNNYAFFAAFLGAAFLAAAFLGAAFFAAFFAVAISFDFNGLK